MSAVTMCYPVERDVAGWEVRHGQGEVPSRWPYGLEGMAGSRASRGELSRGNSLVRALGRVGSAALPRPTRGSLWATWDENTAMRLRPRVARRRASGVIWLTDRPSSSETTRRQAAWLSSFETLWVLSRAQIEPLRALVGSAPRIEAVRFGVDADFYSASPPSGVPRILSLGGDRDRDTETLYRALAQVLREIPGAEVLVQTTSSLPAPDGVRVVTRISHAQLREEYRRARVVMIATRPNLHVSGMTVSLEAMASARPVVITSSPGMEDYVRDGHGGVLVDQGDADALAGHAVGLLRDPARAALLGEQGRSAVMAGMTTAHLCSALDRALGIA